MKYRCIKKFKLDHEIREGGKIERNKITVEEGTEWFWKKEKAEMICVKNRESLVEITINRSDFVNHFERAD